MSVNLLDKKRKKKATAEKENKAPETSIFAQLDKPNKKKCPPVLDAPGVLTERVIVRLDGLQASIDRLLAICLREEHGDSSADEPVSQISKGT